MARVQSQHGPDKASALPLCHPRASLGSNRALKVVRQVGRSVSLDEISHCLLLLHCSCFAHCPCFAPCLAPCCHDPFIVRSASNLSTVPWFHSVCASVSMFTIDTDSCLFLFLFLFLHRISVYISRVSVHISKPLCTSGLHPFTRSIQDPAVECRDP